AFRSIKCPVARIDAGAITDKFFVLRSQDRGDLGHASARIGRDAIKRHREWYKKKYAVHTNFVRDVLHHCRGFPRGVERPVDYHGIHASREPLAYEATM